MLKPSPGLGFPEEIFILKKGKKNSKGPTHGDLNSVWSHMLLNSREYGQTMGDDAGKICWNQMITE